MTEWLLDDRQTGKTTRIVEWANAHPQGYVICHSQAEAHRVGRLIVESEGPGRFPITLEEIDNNMGTWVTGLAIDNLDLILPKLLRLPAPLELVTINTARGGNRP